MDKTEELEAFAKRHGIINVAKAIIEEDKFAQAISEADFTAMMIEAAREYQKPGESPGQSFARMFSADTTEGLMLRKAHAVIKQAGFPSVITAELTQISKARDSELVFDKLGDSELSAYAQLMEKAEQLRKFEPELSKDQAFAKVYQDPKYSSLAQRERNENRPDPRTGTNYPMPRRGH